MYKNKFLLILLFTATHFIYSANAQKLDTTMWVVNGAVNSITKIASTGVVGSYTWFPTTRLSQVANGIVLASSQVTTTYKVYTDNSFGCQDSATVTVQSDIKPQILNLTNSHCPSTSLTLKASNGMGNYSWYKLASCSKMSLGVIAIFTLESAISLFIAVLLYIYFFYSII